VENVKKAPGPKGNEPRFTADLSEFSRESGPMGSHPTAHGFTPRKTKSAIRSARITAESARQRARIAPTSLIFAHENPLL
jgi:hypothetical protein